MLQPLLAATLIAATVNVDRAPPSALAHALVEGIGAVVHKLAVVSDPSVTAEEHGALVVALERTELFELVSGGEAPALIRLSRADQRSMTAVVDGRDGTRLWSGHTEWPVATAEPAPSLDEATRQTRVLRWQSEQVRVMPAERSYVQAPFTDARDSDFFASASRPAHEPAHWQMSYAGSPPVTTLPDEWVIVRGGGEVIDDLRLAQLLGDDPLVRRIEAERFWPRVWWSIGFGAGAAAGVTSGLLLMRSDDRDTRTAGISLLTAGVVAGALALLSPLFEPDHILTAAEAKGLAEVHNERLRQDLGLAPNDVRR